MQKNKKQIVKSIILSFVTHMDAKRLQGLPLTPNERFWISQKKGLEDYIYQQKECLILQSESNASRKKLDALDENALEISPATIYKAITEMEQDGIIENVDGYFRPKRTDGEHYNSHPILKIASDLPITHLPIDDFAVFHVPERYANEIAHYLNSYFYCNDIYTIAVSSLIICLDIKLPSNSKYEMKKLPLISRVKKALKDFNFVRYTDKNIEPGFNEPEAEKWRTRVEESRFLAQIHNQNGAAGSYGGTLKNRPVRKIKCKKVPHKPQ